MAAHFGINHRFILTQKFKHYLEVFAFCSDRPLTEMVDRYLHNWKALNLFKQYFIKNANVLIEQSEKNPLDLNQSRRYLKHKKEINQYAFPQWDVDWIKQASTGKRLVRDYDGKLIFLSEREYQCIGLAKVGYSAKEIARHFDISDRTVETHFIRAKAKLNCRKISELIHYIDHCIPEADGL